MNDILHHPTPSATLHTKSLHKEQERTDPVLTIRGWLHDAEYAVRRICDFPADPTVNRDLSWIYLDGRPCVAIDWRADERCVEIRFETAGRIHYATAQWFPEVESLDLLNSAVRGAWKRTRDEMRIESTPDTAHPF